jgi:hypothetical protein
MAGNKAGEVVGGPCFGRPGPPGGRCSLIAVAAETPYRFVIPRARFIGLPRTPHFRARSPERAPEAYKDIDQVVDVITAAGLSRKGHQVGSRRSSQGLTRVRRRTMAGVVVLCPGGRPRQLPSTLPGSTDGRGWLPSGHRPTAAFRLNEGSASTALPAVATCSRRLGPG